MRIWDTVINTRGDRYSGGWYTTYDEPIYTWRPSQTTSSSSTNISWSTPLDLSGFKFDAEPEKKRPKRQNKDKYKPEKLDVLYGDMKQDE